MEIGDYLKSKKIEFVSDGTLFGKPVLESLKLGRCPTCGNKLYPMLNKPLYYCKSKKIYHKNRVVSKDMYEKLSTLDNGNTFGNIDMESGR